MREALLYHAGIGFVDGVGKRNSAIAGRRTAVLLIALIDHDDFAEFPVAWGCAQKDAIILERRHRLTGPGRSPNVSSYLGLELVQLLCGEKLDKVRT